MHLSRSRHHHRSWPLRSAQPVNVEYTLRFTEISRDVRGRACEQDSVREHAKEVLASVVLTLFTGSRQQRMGGFSPEVAIRVQPEPAQDHVRFVFFAVAVLGAGHRHPAYGQSASRPDVLRERQPSGSILPSTLGRRPALMARLIAATSTPLRLANSAWRSAFWPDCNRLGPVAGIHVTGYQRRNFSTL